MHLRPRVERPRLLPDSDLVGMGSGNWYDSGVCGIYGAVEIDSGEEERCEKG